MEDDLSGVQSAQLTKRYPSLLCGWWSGGSVSRSQVTLLPAVSSVLICPPPPAWLPPSHLALHCVEIGPVLPPHTALGPALTAPHDIMLPTSAYNEGYPNFPEDFTITEKAPTRAFSWLKAPTSAFTFKTLLRHYAEWALIPRSLNMKLGPRRKGHKGRAVWLA